MPDGKDQAGEGPYIEDVDPTPEADVTEPEVRKDASNDAEIAARENRDKAEPAPVSADDARAALQRDREDRVQKANTTVAEILKHYGCRIEIEQTVSGDGRILARATIVAS